MKRFGLIVVLCLIFLTSCASFSVPVERSGIKTVLESKGYEIVGDVKIEGTITSVMGMLTWGGAGYSDLLDKAKKSFKADEVINVSTDIKYSLFFGVFYSQTYILRGTAIKYK